MPLKSDLNVQPTHHWFVEQLQMLSSSFRCDQIYRYEGCYFGHAFFCLCGFWTGPEHRESNLTVLCPLGWKVMACEATGGWTTVQRLVATVWRFGTWWFLLKRELDSLPECLRWWCSGWPPLLVPTWVIPFGIWGIFLQGEKSWGAKIGTSFSVEFSR